MMVAALYVATNGPYFGLDDVDPWDVRRDARRYAGPYPVVAHPPCERWGRYWSGGPNPSARRRELGDDDGCFEAAFRAVQRWGGVLEHPEASHAFKRHGLHIPHHTGGWWPNAFGGWTCCVEQGHYGHPARKRTWLWVHARRLDDWHPPELIWGASAGMRLDEGFHSITEARTERERRRVFGEAPMKRLSAKERVHTPIPFRDLLLSLARSAR